MKQKCDVIQYYDYLGFNYLTAKLLIIYIQTYGTPSKNAIKTKIWHLVIDGTETRFSVFSLKCLTLIVNYKEFLKCYTCNTEKLGQRQNKSNTVLESVLRLGIKGAFTERISFCKQGWVVTHHFVPNFVRELSGSSKTKSSEMDQKTIFCGQTSPPFSCFLGENRRGLLCTIDTKKDHPGFYQQNVQKPASVMVWGVWELSG